MPAEEGEAPAPAPAAAKRQPRVARGEPVTPTEVPPDAAEILELTEPMAIDEGLVSDSAAAASRRSLAALAMSVTKPGATGESAFDSLVRELLRPMLKEWLDANLPAIVDAKVAAEIARITGRG